MGKLISKIPDGPLAQKWTKYKALVKLVNPANKKKLEIIVVGTGLSGAGAASALGELGYSKKTSVTRILREEHIRLLHRVE